MDDALETFMYKDVKICSHVYFCKYVDVGMMSLFFFKTRPDFSQSGCAFICPPDVPEFQPLNTLCKLIFQYFISYLS